MFKRKEDKPRRGFREHHSARWTRGWRHWPAGCAKRLSRGRRGRPQRAKTQGNGGAVSEPASKIWMNKILIFSILITASLNMIILVSMVVATKAPKVQ